MTLTDKKIINSIRYLIETKYKNIQLSDVFNFFKSKVNLQKLAKDIKYIGIENYKDEDEKYLNTLRRLLNIIVEDNDAYIADTHENKKENMKYLKLFENFNVSKNIPHTIKPSSAEQIKNVVKGIDKSYDAWVITRDYGVVGPLQEVHYMGNSVGLSSSSLGHFSSYNFDSSYKDAMESDRVLLMEKEESEKLKSLINYVSRYFHNEIPEVSYPSSNDNISPYREFGMRKPKYIFDGIKFHINLDIPRAVRHPDEYKYYHEGENAKKYANTFKRIQEIEDAVYKISEYIKEKGYKTDIYAW